MANGLVALGATQQEVEDVNKTLKKSGSALAIRLDGSQEPRNIPVTEEYRAGINARRKRLQARNLKVNVQCEVLPEVVKNKDYVVLNEGNYQIGCLRKRWNRVITYLRGEKKLLSLHSKSFFDYYILKEPGEECKVSSAYSYWVWEYVGRDEECMNDTGKNRAITLRNKTLMGWLFVIIFGLFSLTLFAGIAGMVALLFIGGALFPSCGLPGIEGIYSKANLGTWRARRMNSRGVSTRLLEQSPGFCLEKLISSLNSKLLRLIYAEDAESVGDLVSCDMAQFLKNHADVVNCEINNFWFVSLKEDADYMYLDVAYRVELEKDCGLWIRRKKETILLQLARPLQGIMAADFYHDWSVVKIETRKK